MLSASQCPEREERVGERHLALAEDEQVPLGGERSRESTAELLTSPAWSRAALRRG